MNSAFDILETDFLKPNSLVEQLGVNPFLLGFKCGHKYDTRTRAFDLAKPEDMILKVLPHTKAEVEHVEHTKENKLREFFKEVQPDPEAAVYLLDVVSLSMSGI